MEAGARPRPDHPPRADAGHGGLGPAGQDPPAVPPRDPGPPPEDPFEGPDLADFCERVPVALQCLGADGVIRWVNRAELDLLGYSRDEMVGRPATEIHADPAAIREILQRLERREIVRRCPV